MALFRMDSLCLETPREGIKRLSSLSQIDTQIGFDIHLYRRE